MHRCATLSAVKTIPRTDRTLLLDRILRAELGDGLEEVISRLRGNGLGVRDIAAKLTAYTDVQVSYRSVARWLADTEDVAA